MKFFWMLGVAAVWALTAHALDIVTKSGQEYKNYQILGGNEVRVVISHDGGESVVLVDDWPDDRRDELPGRKQEEKPEAAPAGDAASTGEAAPAAKPAPVEFKVAPKILVTMSGREYREYSITGCSGEGVVVTHETGMATVPVEEWPLDKRQEIAPYLEEIATKKKAMEVAKAKQDKELLARYEGRFVRNADGKVFDLGAGAAPVPGQAIPVSGRLEKNGTGATIQVTVSTYSAGDALTPAYQGQSTVTIRLASADFPEDSYGKTINTGVLLLQQIGTNEYTAEQLKPLTGDELLKFLDQHRIRR